MAVAQGTEGRAPGLTTLVSRLGEVFGRQDWWPADSPLEMAVGAVLVQHTTWRNAERALDNLRAADALRATTLAALPPDELERCIRPSGTYRLKALRVRALAHWWLDERHAARRLGANGLRDSLLGVHGIGPETADCIALYAFSKPVFVADAYARRLLHRLGHTPAAWRYDRVRCWAESRLPRNADLLGECHALIVAHGKTFCGATPRCTGCPLRSGCALGAGP